MKQFNILLFCIRDVRQHAETALEKLEEMRGLDLLFNRIENRNRYYTVEHKPTKCHKSSSNVTSKFNMADLSQNESRSKQKSDMNLSMSRFGLGGLMGTALNKSSSITILRTNDEVFEERRIKK